MFFIYSVSQPGLVLSFRSNNRRQQVPLKLLRGSHLVNGDALLVNLCTKSFRIATTVFVERKGILKCLNIALILVDPSVVGGEESDVLTNVLSTVILVHALLVMSEFLSLVLAGNKLSQPPVDLLQLPFLVTPDVTQSLDAGGTLVHWFVILPERVLHVWRL
jgi:hypothetical protein